MVAPKFIVLGVLAGAYRGRQEDRQMQTHAIFGGSQSRAFCGYSASGLVDSFAAEPRDALPSCPACLKKMLKYVENDLAGKPTRFAKGAGPTDS